MVPRTASSVKDPAGEPSHVFRKKTYYGSRIRVQGEKGTGSRIPDTGSATLVQRTASFVQDPAGEARIFFNNSN